MSISESNPFLSTSGSEAPSLSGDFPGGAWNQKKLKTKEVRKGAKKDKKRGEKTKQQCGKNCRFQSLPNKFRKTNSTTHKEAYTHHEINAKLFLPSSIRCQLTEKKISFTQIVNILIT
jgi:hypothetical protein